MNDEQKSALSKQLMALLQPEQVLVSPEDLKRYGQNCEAIRYQAPIVVCARQVSDIKAMLQLANQLAGSELHFSIHPISTGNNWGYGSSRAPNQSSVLLDLSALNQIRLIDAQLGLIEVEPGVTQQQLWEFLQAGQLDFMVPVTGAGPSCSILANALERGYGITPYTDHFGAVASIRGFLADGTSFRSAIAELDQSGEDRIDHSYKYGVGPYLDGLWTQSNLGIVTSLSLRLKARPKGFCAFYLQFKQDTDFAKAQQLVFKLLQRLEGVVGSINLMDQRRLAAMMAPNPNGPAQHQVMSQQQLQTIAKNFQIPAWTVVGSLYGEPQVVAAAQAVVKQLCKGLGCKIILSNGPLIRIASRLLPHLPASWLAKERGMLASMQAGIEIMLGKPNQVALPLPYWRNASLQPAPGNPLNPARDGCGLLWYAPLIPMETKAMWHFVETVRRICPQYGIEPMITFTNLRHDCVDSTIPIIFDASNPTACEQAQACLAALVAYGLEQGWVPYRLNLEQQQRLLQKDSAFWQLVARLKTALDPHHLLSPGRYNP